MRKGSPRVDAHSQGRERRSAAVDCDGPHAPVGEHFAQDRRLVALSSTISTCRPSNAELRSVRMRLEPCMPIFER